MYTIRTDAETQVLRVDLASRLTTGEALRALSQAMALAEASRITAVRVDLSEVERGPGGLLMLAAVFSSRWQEPMRVAFVGNPRQARFVGRFVNFTGRSHALGFFVASEQPDEWLTSGAAACPADRSPRLSPTAERHARELFGMNLPATRQTDTELREPAA